MASRRYTVSAIVAGEDAEVELSIGPPEPRGEPYAGTRDVEVISIRAIDGRDLIEHEAQLDLDDLTDQALGFEEDACAAALEDMYDAAREERWLEDM
jgi:hypothetical protein